MEPDIAVKPRRIIGDVRVIRFARDHKEVTEIRIIGINSLGVFFQSREDIGELIKAGKLVKILLLDPKSNEFIQRIKEVECKYKGNVEDFESHRRRLIAEWNASIMILRNIATNFKNKKLLQVRVRREKPTYALTATVSQIDNNCFASINEYPEKGRGMTGTQFLCKKSSPSEKYTYEKHMAMYQKSWNSAEPVSI